MPRDDALRAIASKENQGLTAEVVQCFVIYLASHSRPAHEILKPNHKDLSQIYESDFAGMTDRAVSLDELVVVRERIGKELVNQLTDLQRAFLLSLTRGDPDWQATGFPHADELPALQWKLENIRKLARSNTRKRDVLVEKLLPSQLKGFADLRSVQTCDAPIVKCANQSLVSV